jgi:hypothetical protein
MAGGFGFSSPEQRLGKAADLDTLGVPPAKIALDGHPVRRVKMDGLIGTGIQTGPAPGACILIQNHPLILGLTPDGLYRAGRNAGSIITVAADQGSALAAGFVLGYPHAGIAVIEGVGMGKRTDQHAAFASGAMVRLNDKFRGHDPS